MKGRTPRSPAPRARADSRQAREVAPSAFAGVTVGRLTQGRSPGEPKVDLDGTPGAAVKARSTVALDEAIIERAVRSRQGVVLQFEGGDPARPIIVGLVQEPKTLLSELLTGSNREAKATKTSAAGGAKTRNEARL